MEKQVLNVKGMMCKHCVKTVTEAVSGAGAKKVKVNLKDGTAAFQCEPDQLDAIKAAIVEKGYEVA
jgi:copper chaperone CopZ